MKIQCVLLASLVSFMGRSQQMDLGPEAGVNLLLIEKTDLGRDYHLGWFAGGNYNYHLSDHFSLRSGVYFSHRKKLHETADTSGLTILGFDVSEFDIPGADFNVYRKTRQVISQFGIELPVMASLNVGKFSVFGGPYINVMVGAWTKERTDTYIPFLQTFDIDSLDPTGFLKYLFPPAESTRFSESSSRDNLRVVDYGFKAGMSYRAEPLQFNLYYTLGIPGYRTDNATGGTENHHYFTVSLAYNFAIGARGVSSFGD